MGCVSPDGAHVAAPLRGGRHVRSNEDWITRKVSVNGVITVAWQQLSVGKHRGGHRVDVHVLLELLEVWDGNELIRTIARTSKGEIRKKRASSRSAPRPIPSASMNQVGRRRGSQAKRATASGAATASTGSWRLFGR